MKGTIGAPGAFFKARKDLELYYEEDTAKENPFQYFDRDETIVIVNRDAGEIKLVHKENDFYQDVIIGALTLSGEYTNLGINTAKRYTPAELGELLRKHRYLFASESEGMEVIAGLKAFNAKITADVKDEKDTRGNRESRLAVKVETGAPIGFALNIPIFKGSEAAKLAVEVVLDGSGHSVTCTLESLEALKAIHEQTDLIIDEELAPFEEYGIAIIET